MGLYLARRIGQSFRLLNQGEEVARVRISDINKYKQVILDIAAPSEWVILREEIAYDETKNRLPKEVSEVEEEKSSFLKAIFGKGKSKEEQKK